VEVLAVMTGQGRVFDHGDRCLPVPEDLLG
jgi:hypothetical protein